MFLRRPLFVSYLSQRFQQTQVKVVSKVKEPQVPLGQLALGPVFRNARLFPGNVAVRDRVAAVPVSPLHPKSLLMYYANDSNSKLIITVPEYADLMSRVANNASTKLQVLDDRLKLNCTLMLANKPDDLEGGRPDTFYNKSNALILYTSGTTANPKGVVLSYKNLSAQAASLLDAWRWNTDDVLLHTLPLHHIHGIVNSLLCPLYAGAKTVMLKKFNANTVWSYLLGVTARPEDRRITLFMGVPTMYSKLVEEYERVFKEDPKMVEYIKNTLKSKIRLMVSGSAPLSQPLFNRWLDITGHRLLERYGMTETGMILSNPYDGDREPGYVGVPLPGVSVKIAKEPVENESIKTLVECSNIDGTVVIQKNGQKDAQGNDPTGELLVRGDAIFTKYHDRPDTTKQEFTLSGWFKTGDVCQYSVEKKKFKILGRKSIDVVKSGGHKISTLEIESALLGCPEVKDCAVVGLPDEKWGQKVAAVVATTHKIENSTEIIEKLRIYAEERLPRYAVPKEWKFVEKITKNAMGKVDKKFLIRSLFGEP
ncbi:malonate--CoA ligase ACSF3, mitochondrial-like isoform X2 [Sitophilus oryzae]|uniref:Malonate--CoA ligase ACSF3, mitochondrial-like isoform X2 n=1 Tax=Sitophilus oryzae TaxID=7048 RepID=A0A6J2XIY3_SITOR|nr:malonate--CoA ligase ACSF3, mitochondrial-like isoform X2 [Sitophilus oryzae]